MRTGARDWAATSGLLALVAALAAAGSPAAAGDTWAPTVSTAKEAAEAPAEAPAEALTEAFEAPPAGPVLHGTLDAEPLETGAVQPRPAASYTLADSAALEGDAGRTTFRLGLSKGVTAEVFTLANPFRVVVDLPDVAFGLDERAGRESRGLVKAFRYGLFAEGKARIVLDVTGPVRIDNAGMSAGADGRRVELKIDIVPMAADNFGAGTGAQRQAAPAKIAPSEDAAPDPKKGAKPVIVIDPGHGGIDPGAVGSSQLLEKAIALSVGLELRRALLAGGRYEVRMTRSTDVFVSLDRRLKICRESGADLFVSLHADSLEEKSAANSIRGATVYTLSEKASDEQARVMAEKENASDLIAGLDAGETGGGDQVKGILIDLMKRETANFSTEFSRTLVGRIGRSVTLSRDPQRSAAFKVLKQTHAPAVLLELGYMSNPADEKLLASSEWQRNVAAEVRAAVDQYFAKQTARIR